MFSSRENSLLKKLQGKAAYKEPKVGASCTGLPFYMLMHSYLVIYITMVSYLWENDYGICWYIMCKLVAISEDLWLIYSVYQFKASSWFFVL
jgi:hypothetical protein